MGVERIDIKQFDMANEQVINTDHLYVELADNYFFYAGKYQAKHPKGDNPEDHSLGWENRRMNFRIKIKREQLIALELRFIEYRGIWSIDIDAMGYPVTIKIYFEKGADAKILYDKLDTYIFKT